MAGSVQQAIAAPAATAAARTAAITRAAARFCRARGWAPLAEVPLPDGRRADLLALCPDGRFALIEVKSGARDFLADAKWPAYRAWCDALYFAVDLEFPVALLPEDAGLIVADGLEAALLREAPACPLAPARRKSLLHRFAMLAAGRLAGIADPAGEARGRSALRAD